MDKKGMSAVIGIMIFLIIVVLTSATILLLVKTGVVEVEEREDVSVLNTEFLPSYDSGTLIVRDFMFCSDVINYQCVGEGDEYDSGSEVHFMFNVETSTRSGSVMLQQSYEVRGPNGKVLLSSQDHDVYEFSGTSSKKTENIIFRDFFVLGNIPSGEYVLDVIIKNQATGKQATFKKTFYVVEPETIDGFYDTEGWDI